jgi:hypothetical protein
MPRPREEPDWTQAPCVRIGRVLLNAPHRILTAAEIQDRGGGPNVARTAKRLVEAGMLMEERPAPLPEAKGPGRQAAKAFHLPDDQVDRVKAVLAAQAPSAGQLVNAQQLVFADIGNGRIPALMEALDAAPALAKAAWFTLCDGQPQEYVIAFSGADAVSSAQALVVELQAGGLTARRASIAQVGDAATLATDVHAGAIASRKARMRRVG